ncbi:MAG: PilX N-terminal domain-containing pilus assembly protein [Candidatus Thiodiazotropha endolucinida]
MTTYTRLFSNHRKKQSGAALVISMVLLLIITMLSVTAMRNTNFETKIAVNHQFKELSFRAAENALAIVTGPELDSTNLDIPSTIGNTAHNVDFFESHPGGTPIDPTLAEQPPMSVDVDLLYEDKIDPKEGKGNMLFSGHQLDIVTHLFQVDAVGTVGGSGTRTHNRMQVALIRQ